MPGPRRSTVGLRNYERRMSVGQGQGISEYDWLVFHRAARDPEG
jgi:hypothetical protein